MSATQTVLEFHETLTKEAAKASKEMRYHPHMKIGRWAMQGDVYIHKIKEAPKAWSTETTHETRQVALGTTEGSRHCAQGNVRVFWPSSAEEAMKEIDRLVPGFSDRLGSGASPCIGPVVVGGSDWQLVHPEHAHHEFPKGVYLVTYQLDIRTMRQVRD